MSHQPNGPLNPEKVSIGSKRKPCDLSFHQLYKKLCNSISEDHLQELQQELSKINDELFSTLEKMDCLIKKRQQKNELQNKKTIQAMSKLTSNLESSMSEILTETAQESDENFSMWNLLKEKKINYEKMHQNLLEMKRKTIGFGMFKKQGK